MQYLKGCNELCMREEETKGKLCRHSLVFTIQNARSADLEHKHISWIAKGNTAQKRLDPELCHITVLNLHFIKEK